MDQLIETLKQPFTWGLLLGLLVAAFAWKSGFSARRAVARDLKRVEEELKNLQSHLNTQLKITSSGNDVLQAELESLRKQNELLRMNNAALQQKPDRAQQKLLQIHEVAIRTMREQAPGFAPAWEKAMRQGEAEVDAAESGLKKLVRRVIPQLGTSPPASGQLAISEEAAEEL
jgi:hypothetical protein